MLCGRMVATTVISFATPARVNEGRWSRGVVLVGTVAPDGPECQIDSTKWTLTKHRVQAVFREMALFPSVVVCVEGHSTGTAPPRSHANRFRLASRWWSA